MEAIFLISRSLTSTINYSTSGIQIPMGASEIFYLMKNLVKRRACQSLQTVGLQFTSLKKSA